MIFKGLLIKKNEDETISCNIEELKINNNEELDTLVEISCSTVNYKDSLAISGKPGIIRTYPMVPGIDFAGKVVDTKSSLFKKGDKVILNGFGVGEKYWGGLSQFSKVKAKWLIHKPSNLSDSSCMSLGTAGYTAMLCILEILNNKIRPNDGRVLVTGATGGVGSFAVMILSKLGFSVVAATGKANQKKYLSELGAVEIIPRDIFSEPPKALEKEKWVGVIETVGSLTLSHACASTKYGGVVASCGMAQGMKFTTSVAPFILRNIKLSGIDSVYRSINERKEAWKKLSETLDEDSIKLISSTIKLDEVTAHAKKMLNQNTVGRVIVDIKNSL